jgi:MoaA/NifB/PqqE/SkfB family radical SAM enzyme
MDYILKPYVLAIRTTERCNVGCYHCSISATPNGSDIPLNLACSIIKKAADYGIGMLHLSGGEPLNYPYLVDLVKKGKECGMMIEMVTSTYTTPNKDNTDILYDLVKHGLNSIMLSYDDAHARNVEVGSFCNFIKKAQNLGVDICVFATEGIHTELKTDIIKQIIQSYDVEIDNIDWATSMYQYTGRGIAKLASDNPQNKFNYRCPYVNVVPTIRPNGDILLCPCSVLNSTNFIIGNVYQNDFYEIMERFIKSTIYRCLAKFGPQKSLEILGLNQDEIPYDMCQCCEKYLCLTESAVYKLILKANNQLFNDENLFVDFNALLIPHKRFLNTRFRKE